MLEYDVKRNGENALEQAQKKEVRELLSGLTCDECGRSVKPVQRDGWGREDNTSCYTIAACRFPLEDACSESKIRIETRGEGEFYDGARRQPYYTDANWSIERIADILSETRAWRECPSCGMEKLVPAAMKHGGENGPRHICAHCGESWTNWKQRIVSSMDSNDENESDIEVIQYAAPRGGEKKETDTLDKFDYLRDTGFGGETCNTVRIYTADHIYITTNYDGSQSIGSIPRNPSNEPVRMFGGG